MFGDMLLTLNLGLRRNFTWNFCVAAVPNPIIGADLLANYHSVPFLHQSKLVDALTGPQHTSKPWFSVNLQYNISQGTTIMSVSSNFFFSVYTIPKYAYETILNFCVMKQNFF